MKIKERLKNAGFWVSLISAVFLIVGAFGVEVADETVSSVINAVCSALVVFGIISDPTAGKGYLDEAKGDALISGETEPVDAPAENDDGGAQSETSDGSK